MISNVIHTEPAPLHMQRPDIPPALESVLACLLKKEPGQRYASAQAALGALAYKSGDWLQEPTMEIAQLALSNERPEAITSPSDEEPLSLPEDSEPQGPPQALLLYAATEEVTNALESERRRMAGLLKNEVMEPLNLLLSQANTYEKTLGANQMAHVAVSVLSTLARQVLQQVRDLDENLQPMALETMGLEAALENLANQLRRTRGLQIHLELARFADRLSARLELALFRLCQDYFAAIHSTGASRVDVRVKRREHVTEFEITNNASTVLDARLLAGSREWLEQLGCTWQAETEKNQISIRFRGTKPLDLTPRELDVIRLVAEGLSNKEIGQQLAISPRTVNFHLDNLFAKLGVRSRTEAAILALRQGWVERKSRPV